MGRLLGKFFGSAFTQETPGGTTNGVNTAFTLANTPVTAASLILTLNGLVLVQSTDYTLSGANITMTTAPDATQSLLAYYVR